MKRRFVLVGIGAMVAGQLVAVRAHADDDAAEEKVILSVTADDDRVLIERRTNIVEGWQTTLGIPVFTTTEQWEPACAVPCTLHVSPHVGYRASGRGIATSHEFLLPKGPEVKLEVKARSSLWYGSGIGLTIVGGVLAVVGGTSTLVSSNITSTEAETTVRGFGLGLLVAGGVMLAVGIPLWLTGRSAVKTPDGRTL
jgi:hypothetical protein